MADRHNRWPVPTPEEIAAAVAATADGRKTRYEPAKVERERQGPKIVRHLRREIVDPEKAVALAKKLAAGKLDVSESPEEQERLVNEEIATLQAMINLMRTSPKDWCIALLDRPGEVILAIRATRAAMDRLAMSGLKPVNNGISISVHVPVEHLDYDILESVLDRNDIEINRDIDEAIAGEDERAEV